MMDQLKVLQFIQNNIAAFHGDPNRVTLFGQSAGASSSSLHMFSPMSRGMLCFCLGVRHANPNLYLVVRYDFLTNVSGYVMFF